MSSSAVTAIPCGATQTGRVPRSVRSLASEHHHASRTSSRGSRPGCAADIHRALHVVVGDEHARMVVREHDVAGVLVDLDDLV